MVSQVTRNVLAAVAVLLLALVVYIALTMPDQRSTSQKIGDAVHELPNGPGKAARELEDRTPGQRMGDAIKDNTQSH